MNTKILLLIASLCTAPVSAQAAVGVGGRAEKDSSSTGTKDEKNSATNQPLLNPSQFSKLQIENEKIRFDLIASTNRLVNLEGAITKASERSESASIRSSWFAFFTVLFSVAFGLLGQYFLIRHQRSLNKEQEKAKVSNAYIEWQLKQLSVLYGPLRALLGQSIAIYRQMNMVLIAADGKRFRLEPKPGADADGFEFQIFLDESWERFRTVEHLPVVYKKGYGVEPYFDDVVKAGAAIAEMIRQNAGYVRQEDKKLIEVMGIYLAHYGVLCRLHERAVNGEEVKPTSADIKASFPHTIHALVDQGFNAINTQVMDWKNFRSAQAN